MPPPIPSDGLLTRGRLVEIAWPRPSEFDDITILRNAPCVRRWFLDDRTIDLDTNRNWLAHGMNRPTEALLSIRLVTNSLFLGFCGWSDWNPTSGSIVYGRFALDIEKLSFLKCHFPPDYIGVALDVGLTMRDFAFRKLAVNRIITSYIVGNRFAARINSKVGLIIVDQLKEQRPSGEVVETVHLQLTRSEWSRQSSQAMPN